MPGIPGGGSGPVPKRSDQRRRRNKVDGLTKVPAPVAAVESPAPPEGLHAIAADWYASLRMSGQAAYYEPSDWQTARYLAEAMSRNLKAQRFSAQLFASVMSGMTELLTTEGARRRARFEIQRDALTDPTTEDMVYLDDVRKRLSGS